MKIHIFVEDSEEPRIGSKIARPQPVELRDNTTRNACPDAARFGEFRRDVAAERRRVPRCCMATASCEHTNRRECLGCHDDIFFNAGVFAMRPTPARRISPD